MRIIFLLVITMLAVSACSKKVKETIGISTAGPNEYRVTRNKSLEVPPHYDLPAIGAKDSKKNSTPSLKKLNDAEKALIEEMKNK
jgi:hypothetical protein